MVDRRLRDVSPDQLALADHVQELVEAERGAGEQGVLRTWRASDSARVVLVSDASGVKISRDNGTTAPTHVINDGTAAGGALTGPYPAPTLAPATIHALLPPGTVWAFAGGFAPTGWLLCNGATVSRTTYALLYAVIGTAYNTGGEAGTDFRLPNLTGRVVLGVSGTHGLTTTGGSETAPGPAHTHPGSHSHGLNSHTHGMQSHVHGLNGHAHSLNGHQHSVDLNHGHTASAGGGTGATDQFSPVSPGVVMVRDTHAHAITVNGLGATSTTVAASGTANTGTNSGNSDIPSATDTGTAVGSTATDATAAAASYPGTIPVLPPFLSLTYIIRSGV